MKIFNLDPHLPRGEKMTRYFSVVQQGGQVILFPAGEPNADFGVLTCSMFCGSEEAWQRSIKGRAMDCLIEADVVTGSAEDDNEEYHPYKMAKL